MTQGTGITTIYSAQAQTKAAQKETNQQDVTQIKNTKNTYSQKKQITKQKKNSSLYQTEQSIPSMLAIYRQ